MYALPPGRFYMRLRFHAGSNTRRVRHLSRLRTPLRVRLRFAREWSRERVCRVKHETEIPVRRSTRTLLSPYTHARAWALQVQSTSSVRVTFSVNSHTGGLHGRIAAFTCTRERASNGAAHATNAGNIKSPFNIFTRAGENDEVSCFLIMYPRAPEPRNSRLGAPLFLAEKLLASTSFYPPAPFFTPSTLSAFSFAVSRGFYVSTRSFILRPRFPFLATSVTGLRFSRNSGLRVCAG